MSRCGVKIVSVIPGNAARGRPVVPATVVLLDGETGEVDALLDGTVLTQRRTAAVAGVATELLAREDAAVGALFGTGGQATLLDTGVCAIHAPHSYAASSAHLVLPYEPARTNRPRADVLNNIWQISQNRKGFRAKSRFL